MSIQRGYKEYTVPARTVRSCWGCYHLLITKMLMGCRDVEGSFECVYPHEGGDGRFQREKRDTDRYLGYGSINQFSVPVPLECPYRPENKKEDAPDTKNEGEAAQCSCQPSES